MLNPFAAPRMLRYDWVTYISAPNFLRSAPLLTFPLGRTPDYMAPVGSSLGLADASPYMLPVYRLLNVISRITQRRSSDGSSSRATS